MQVAKALDERRQAVNLGPVPLSQPNLVPPKASLYVPQSPLPVSVLVMDSISSVVAPVLGGNRLGQVRGEQTGAGEVVMTWEWRILGGDD